jgi:deoxyribodipyrimidine photo-lyase
VAAVYILDPVFSRSGRVGAKRESFLLDGLKTLDEALRSHGGRLIIRQGEPLKALQQLVIETGANHIYAEADYTNYALQRDQRVQQHLPVEYVSGLTVMPPGSVLKSDGQPYVVFSPFARRWKQQAEGSIGPEQPMPAAIRFAADLETVALTPGGKVDPRFPPGEASAQQRLTAFLDGGRVFDYQRGRDRLDVQGTSLLSPYLRFGMLSARQAVLAAQEAIASARGKSNLAGATQWLDELIWREFYHHILFHFPQVQTESFRPAYRDFSWSEDEAALAAWKEGQTGYPVIDAAMRQLKTEGWMPNRARMLVASFLTKHLLVDWRWGERWFMRHLIDGDVAANNGGWQWAAGTGTDAAPYFRIFNPTTQAKKHDPQGNYIRRWVPELSGLSAEDIHEPWQLSASQRQALGAVDYPAPIVDHAWARQRALDQLSPKKSKSS